MKTIKSFSKLFLIFLSLCTYINCDCTCSVSSVSPLQCIADPSGDSSCVCKYQYPSSCIFCDSSIFSSGNVYYSINGATCSGSCLGDKIIDNTKECTSEDLMSSGNFYKLGDVYYYSNPPSDTTNIDCPDSKICKCKKYFYIQYVNGKKIYKCFSDTDTTTLTTFKYYNYKTNEFFSDGCPDEFKVELETTISGQTVTRCSDTCLDGEFYSSQIVDGVLKETCSSSCSGKTYIVNGVKKCISDCGDVNLYEN